MTISRDVQEMKTRYRLVSGADIERVVPRENTTQISHAMNPLPADHDCINPLPADQHNSRF